MPDQEKRATPPDKREPDPISFQERATEKLFSSGFNRYHVSLGVLVVLIGYTGIELVQWLLARSRQF